MEKWRPASPWWARACLVVSCLLVTLVLACSAEARIRVVTTTPDLADITSNIGGDLVEVQSLARGYQDPHMMAPRAEHLSMLRNADLLVQMGLGLETPWLPALLQGSHNPTLTRKERCVDASLGITVIRDPQDCVDPALEYAHRSGNPHYHLDPANVKIMGRTIAEALKLVDPGHASSYETNLVTYVKRLSEASARWSLLAARIKGRRVMVYHNSWAYFAQRFGLVVAGQAEARSRSLLVFPAPSAEHLAELAQRMKTDQIDVVIMEPYVSPGVIKPLLERTGASLLVLPSSVGGEPGTDSYIDLITHDLEKLVDVFTRTRVR